MTDGETWVCLDLFSGLGGFSAAFRESDDWAVVTVDIDGRFGPDLRADVFDLRPADVFDAIGYDCDEIDVFVVLASPPCNTFSKVAAWNDHWDADGRPGTPSARESVALLYHALGLIKSLAPDWWFVENPEGHARQFLGEPAGRVTYCQYGTTYQKPTDLWGEHPPMTYRRCSNGEPCHESKPRRERPGIAHPTEVLPSDPAERAKVPYQLSEAIREAVEAAVENPPPEQATLADAGGETP